MQDLPSLTLLRRLLVIAGSSSLAACGGRGDLADTSYKAAAGDVTEVEVTAGSGGSGQAGSGGSGGSSAGKGGTAGAAGSSAGSGGSINIGGSGGTGGSGGSGGSGGAGGSAGAPVCDNPLSPPKSPNGGYECSNPNGTFGFCELRCYAPNETTIPGPCRAPGDPALAKLPGLQPETCGFKTAELGPYCNAEVEKIGGNTPICCYLGLSEPCAGRPLRVDERVRMASLRRGSW